MTKEEAARILEVWKEKFRFTDGGEQVIDLAIEALKSEPKWIPVSERLPENDGAYLAWARYPHEEEYKHTIINYSADIRAFGEWREWRDNHTLGFLDSYFEEFKDVIAWAPLPEPYSTKRKTDE